MFTQQVCRLGLLFAEDRHQHVGTAHFAPAGGLHVEYRTLQYALEAERRLRVALLFAGGQRWCGLFDKGFQLLA
ncbi:hypothetical protein D3C75_1263960 [compost metagenome]